MDIKNFKQMSEIELQSVSGGAYQSGIGQYNEVYRGKVRYPSGKDWSSAAKNFWWGVKNGYNSTQRP